MNQSEWKAPEDYSIRIKDLIYHVLLHWRSIIGIALLVFAVVCAAKTYLTYKSAGVTSAEDIKSLQEDYDLASGQVVAMQKTVQYYEKQIDYYRNNENSVYMNIDPFNVHRMNLSFKFNNVPEGEIDTVQNMMSVFVTSSLLEKLGTQQSVYSTTDLAACVLYYGNSKSYVLTSQESFEIEVIGNSEEELKALEVLLKQDVIDYGSTIAKQYAGVTVSFVNDGFVTLSDTTIAEKQQKALENMTENLTAYSTAQESEKNAETRLAAAQASLEAAQGTMSTKSMIKSGLKYGILAGVVVGFLGVCIAALAENFSGKVRGPQDLEDNYGLMSLGSVYRRRRSLIDRKLDAWESDGVSNLIPSEQTALISNCVIADNKSIVIRCAGKNNQKRLPSAEQLKEIFGNETPVYNGANEAVEMIKVLDADEKVILVVCAGATTYTEIGYISRMLSCRGNHIAGYIYVGK